MRKKNIPRKSGQVTESFTFLSAAIIIGLILLFGGYSVYKLLDNIETIEETQFRQNIESKISSVSSKYGSVEIFELDGIKEYEKVCVFDLVQFNESGKTFSDFEELSSYGLMEGEVSDNTANFFLVGNDNIEERFLNTNIRMDSPYYDCEEVGSLGVVKIRLEGLGKMSKLSFVEFNITG